MGGLCNTLRFVPFLPFARTVELGEAIIGGAYLYSSDLWAPYVDKRRRGVSTRYASWLLGFGKARSERLVGWVPIRDLDLKGEAAVVRVLQDAVDYGGLLRRAIRHLYGAWQACTGRARKETWMGRALKMIQRVWPAFRVSLDGPGGLRLVGIPALKQGFSLHVIYRKEAALLDWRRRQNNILRKPPTLSQHDYFVWSYLQKACTQLELQQLEQRNGGRVARIAPLSDNIFQILPRADTGAVQVLLRTLAGLEDFARVNAHQKRRELHPLLADNEFKHNCLSCLVYRNVKVLDSEWHSFCECPEVASARARFSDFSTIDIPCSTPCTVSDLCELVTSVANDPRKAGALAQLALNIRATRRHLFRKLSANGPNGRVLVAANLSQLLN